MKIHSRILLALLVGSVALSSGCGSKSSTTDAPADAPPPVKVLASEKSAPVTAMALQGEVLVVGTKTGLKAFDYAAPALVPSTKLETKGASGVDVEVRSIRADETSVIAATKDGLTTYEGGKWSSDNIGPTYDAVRFGGTIWVARSSSLESKTSENDWKTQLVPSIKLNPTLSGRVKSFTIGKEDHLWFATEFGIYDFDHAKKLWGKHRFGDFQNIMGDVITDEKGNSPLCGNQSNRIEFDKASGNLLICTETGLSLFDGADRWTHFQGDYEVLKSEGTDKSRVTRKGNVNLPSPSVTCAAIAGSRTWIGTQRGLAMVENGQVTLLGDGDGLPADHITSLVADPARKVLFVGTTAGIAVVGPLASSSPPASAAP